MCGLTSVSEDVDAFLFVEDMDSGVDGLLDDGTFAVFADNLYDLAFMFLCCFFGSVDTLEFGTDFVSKEFDFGGESGLSECDDACIDVGFQYFFEVSAGLGEYICTEQVIKEIDFVDSDVWCFMEFADKRGEYRWRSDMDNATGVAVFSLGGGAPARNAVCIFVFFIERHGERDAWDEDDSGGLGLLAMLEYGVCFPDPHACADEGEGIGRIELRGLVREVFNLSVVDAIFDALVEVVFEYGVDSVGVVAFRTDGGEESVCFNMILDIHVVSTFLAVDFHGILFFGLRVDMYKKSQILYMFPKYI